MASTIFKIEEGTFALSLVGDADDTAWNAPAGKTVDAVLLTDYTTPGPGGDFSCQITSGALTASPNQTDEVTPATFCQAEVTTVVVGVTSYVMDCSFLQDPNVVAGLNRFLFEHDTKLAYFFLGLDSMDPPKVAGKVRLVAGTIGGDARVTLTADLSLPVEQKPDIEFGLAAASIVIHGDGSTPTTPAAMAARGGNGGKADKAA